MFPGMCGVEGCPNLANRNRLCRKHYYQIKKVRGQSPACSVRGCFQPAQARGWCPKHYQRWVRTGSPDDAPKREQTVCSAEGCDDGAKSRGMCRKHYSHWYREQQNQNKPHRPKRGCSIEGCDRPHRSKGLCSLHYHRKHAYGDPLALPPTCSVEECGGKRWRDGYCLKHHPTTRPSAVKQPCSIEGV